MITVKTQYNLAIYKEFFWFCLFRGKYYRYGKKTFTVVTILLIVLSISSFLWLHDRFLSVITTIGAAICVLFYAMSFLTPKAYVKKSPSLFLSTTEFVFGSDDFSIFQTGDITNSTGTTKYEALLKAYETKKAFYLFLTPRQALLLAKEDFGVGTPEDLRALLRAKLPQGKFILCK